MCLFLGALTSLLAPFAKLVALLTTVPSGLQAFQGTVVASIGRVTQGHQESSKDPFWTCR